MLITLAIVIVMYTMLLSKSSANKQRQLKADCAQNLSYVYSALQTYANDHQGAFPVVKTATSSEEPLSVLVPKYTTVTAKFICPGQGASSLPDAKPFADRRISYAYYMGQAATQGADQPLLSDAQINTRPKPKGDQLFSSDGKKPANNHHKFGGVVLFCDGAAQTTGAKAAFDLPLATNVVLLNPKP